MHIPGIVARLPPGPTPLPSFPSSRGKAELRAGSKIQQPPSGGRVGRAFQGPCRRRDACRVEAGSQVGVRRRVWT